MANTKSSKKSVRSQERKRKKNFKWKAKVKRVRKEFELLLASPEKNPDSVTEHLNKAKKTIDKAVKNGPYHPNKGSRIKSKLDKKAYEWAKLNGKRE